MYLSENQTLQATELLQVLFDTNPFIEMDETGKTVAVTALTEKDLTRADIHVLESMKMPYDISTSEKYIHVTFQQHANIRQSFQN